MKRILIFGCMIFALIFAVYAMDSEKARKAIMTGEYIPALMDYGFTEQKIKSWRFAGTYLTTYFKPNSYVDLNMTISSIRNCIQLGELTTDDMTKIEQFLRDIHAFKDNERRSSEEVSRQRAQAEEAQRTQAREQRELELKQYAQSFGLADYIEGVFETQMEVTSDNFELLKKLLLIPNDLDLFYSVQNLIDEYVIYSAVYHGTVYQIALVAERGKTYPSKSQFDLNSVYKVEGTKRFARTLGGSADLIVIKRLGPKR